MVKSEAGRIGEKSVGSGRGERHPSWRKGLTSRTTHPQRYLRRLAPIPGKGGAREKPSGRCAITLVLLAVVVLVPSFPQTARAEVDPASVQRAIDRGVAYLRKSQNQRGGWNEFGSQSCGLSALCTLALLNCGVEQDDPAIASAMRYLRGFTPQETYSVALQTLVFCQLGSARDVQKIRDNVNWLASKQIRNGERVGGWNYGTIGAGDPSNSQFAVLALGAAKDRGIEVDPAVFQRALGYWVKRQRRGWTYHGGGAPSGSMTCAGIASIVIARSGLQGQSSRIEGDTLRCCGGTDSNNDPVEIGLSWLGNAFSVNRNPGSGSDMTQFYYLYALERVGRLSGRRFIGGHDWYREGAEWLLQQQDGFQGFWGGKGQMGEGNRDVTTSFALLFLSKGKRQVVVSRLKHQGQWQQHPEGLRLLVRQIERDWGRDLTWQTIEGERATLVDLLQTPVLVISGREPLRVSKGLSQRLKDYVEQGGCLFFEADGGDGCGDASGFEQSVQDLCGQWYPEAKLDRLPPSHPIWFARRKVDPTVIGDDFWVYGVQACCRTAIFYVPRSLSCRWQLGDLLQSREENSPAVRRQVEAGFRLGENLIAYATGRDLKEKLESRTVIKANDLPAADRGSIQLAMLSMDAGGNEARRAVPNAATLIGKRLPVPVTAAREPVGFDLEQLQDVPLLWIHGRTDFTFSSEQREVLAQYMANGGMVLGTAICGSQAFNDAFRREIALVLPESPLRALPGDHPALTNSYGGFDLRAVTIRSPAEAAGDGLTRRTGPPVLEFATLDGLACVFYSPLDISCALESQNSVQCPGYATDDAARIVANLLLFGLQQ